MAAAAHSRVLFTCILFFAFFYFVFAQNGYVYQLDTEYSGANFFQGWDFYTGGDPTGGYVTYYSQASAQQAGIINSSATAPVYMGVDYQTITNVNGAGRPSVRISTQKQWTHGLFIGDFNHAPGGICGTWPAWWTIGPNWPYNGEIDIMEGVNQLTQNAMSLHSLERNVNCSIAGDPTTETGTVQGQDCAYYVQYGGNGQGCGVQDSRTTSYGTGFNSVGGGVYAMQWTSDYIRVWFFQRTQIPQDITSLTPNPSNWGLPAANLQGSCTIDQRFQSHSIIFDNTFCGSYAGVPSVWNASVNSCLLQTGYPTCNAFVAAQPAAFQNSYWSINSVRVYQLQAFNASASASSTPYIASLQPTVSSASTASSVAVAVPTANLCPTYNFTIVQEGSFQYEIECGYNPPGNNLGAPYPNYHVASFEDCIGGCTYWNTYNGSYICAGVAYVVVNQGCYWKNSISSSPAAPGFNGARLIYYGYPQIADSPITATTTSNSVFVSTSVAAQHYINPNSTFSRKTLSTASGTFSGAGVGAGFSVVASSYLSSTSSSSTILSSSSSTASLTISSPTAVSSLPTTSAISTSSATTSTLSISSSILISSSLLVSSSSSTAALTTPSTTSMLSTTSLASTSTLAVASSSPTSSSSPILSSSQVAASSSQTSLLLSSSPTTLLQPPVSSYASSSTYFSTPTPSVAASVSSHLANSLPSASSLTSSANSLPSNNPQSVAQFKYGGCQGSSNNFAGFREVETAPTMSIVICASDCYRSAYAGLFGDTCYCADDPTVANYFVTYPDTDCDTPCPGSPSQSCGGVILTKRQLKRQADVAYTIYNNTNLLPGPGAVSSSSSLAASSNAIASGSVIVDPVGVLGMSQISAIGISLVPPTSSSPGLSTSSAAALTSTSTSAASSGTVILKPGGGSLISNGTSAAAWTLAPTVSTSMTLHPTAITIAYVDICDVCEHGMTTATTIITVMHCGCTESVNEAGSTLVVPTPTVPMTTTVKTCNCGEANAPSTTEVTVPCTSQIEEMSSSMASMLASAAVGSAGPTQAPTAEATGQDGNEAPAAGAPAGEATAGAETASEARSGDLPELTSSLAPETGVPAGDNETGYATTQTIHLQSTETSNATAPNNGSMVVSAPRLAGPSATKKSGGNIAAERLVGFMIGALFNVVVVISLL